MVKITDAPTPDNNSDGPATPTPIKTTTSRPGKIAQSLSKMYGTVGMMLYPFDMQCGTAVMENADNCANALEQLAKENEAVRRVLTKVVEGTAWGGVAAAHAPMLMAIMAHHGTDLRNLVRREGKPESEPEPESDTPQPSRDWRSEP